MKTTYFTKYSSSRSTRFVRAAAALSLVAVALGVGCGQAPKIDAISVTADAIEPLPKGATRQYSAIAHYSDNTTQDISSLVVWQVAADGSISVSNKTGSRGLVTAVNLGVGILSATEGEVTGKAVVGVTDAELRSILVSPPSPVLANGTTVELTATGVYTDLSNRDLTKKVVWTTADATTASLVASGDSGGLLTGLRPGAAEIAASLAGIDGKATVTVTSAPLKQLAVTPLAATLAKGTMLQLVATGTFSDNTTQDLTSLAVWTAGAGAVATVSNQSGSKGLVSGISKGPAAIQAAFGGQVSAANLTITDATLSSVTVTPVSPAIASGTSVPLVATGNFSDGTTQDLSGMATWVSSAPTIAAVSPAGLVSGLGKGQASISAMLTGKTGSTTLTVSDAVLTSIAVTPVAPAVAAGTKLQLAAIGTYSDNSTQDITSLASWTSSSTALATVSSGAGSRGLLLGIAAGTATITAALSGVASTANLTITNATLSSIVVTPATPVLAKGTTRQLTATGVYSDGTTADLTTQVAWSSSNNALASISNAAGSIGLATAISLGTVNLTATLGGVQGTTTLGISSATLSSIQVSAPNSTIALGTSEQYTAVGIYSDGSNQDITSLVTWSSTMASTATVSNASGTRGLVTSVAMGSTSISASLSGVTGSRNLTVSSATLASIMVTPGGAFLAKGTQQSFTATGVFSDGTMQDLTTAVSWSSSAGSVAVVDNSTGAEGLVTAVAAGTSMITATDAISGKSGTTRVTVTSAVLVSIAITPSNATIVRATSIQLTAIGTYNDGRKQDLTELVTWSSSSPWVIISNATGSEGLAMGVASDVATITAQLSGKTSTTMLTVTSPTLVSIAVTPMNARLPVGVQQQYVAIGSYSDGSTQDLTFDPSLTWISDAPSAFINNFGPMKGQAFGAAPGTVNILAMVGPVVGRTMLTVTMARLTSTEVLPATALISAGGTRQFTAVANFDDGSTIDITGSVFWSSSDPLKVSIDGRGLALATGMVGDTATIMAFPIRPPLPPVLAMASVTIN